MIRGVLYYLSSTVRNKDIKSYLTVYVFYRAVAVSLASLWICDVMFVVLYNQTKLNVEVTNQQKISNDFFEPMSSYDHCGGRGYSGYTPPPNNRHPTDGQMSPNASLSLSRSISFSLNPLTRVGIFNCIYCVVMLIRI